MGLNNKGEINMNNDLKQKTLDKLAKELEEIAASVKSEPQKDKTPIPEAQIQMMKQQATVLIRYIMKRCIESESLCEDVLQEHKSWKRCMKYVFEKAKEFALSTGSGQMACVPDETVYEWAEDYYRLDDKEAVEKEIAEEKAKQEKREKEKAEREEKERKRKEREAKKKEKEKQEKEKQESSLCENEETDVPVKNLPEEPKKTVEEEKVPETPVKNEESDDSQLEGQMDIFSFL